MAEQTKKWLTPKQVSEQLHLALSTLARYRGNGSGPRYYKTPSKILYDEADILEWMAAKTASNTSDYVQKSQGVVAK